MEFEQVQAFWEGVGPEQKEVVFRSDPVLRFFDAFSVLEVAEGKLLKFDVDKIAEMQDKVDNFAPCGEDECVREIFAPGATRNMNVRSHKLVKVIKDQLTRICESGDLPACGESSAEAAAPASNAAPARGQEPPSDGPATSYDEVKVEPQWLQLAPDLPEGAQINVRSEPHSEGGIVSKIDSSSQVLAVARCGDWARVRSSEFGEAYVLTAIQDRVLLVPVPGSSSPAAPPSVPSAKPAHSQPLPAAGSPPTKSALAAQPALPHTPPSSARMAPEYVRDPTLTPSRPGADPAGYVTLEEHNRLRYKVAQLEADMRALRLLLRSWSLDTPSQGM